MFVSWESASCRHDTSGPVEPIDNEVVKSQEIVEVTVLVVIGTVVIPVALIVSVSEPETPLPSLAVAVIVTWPAATPETRPLLSTVATEVLLELHVTVLFVASSGKTVAVN